MATSMSGGRGFSGDIIPKGYQVGQLQNYTPQQMQLHQQQFQHVGPQSYLSRLAGGDQSFFDEIEAPAKRDFNQILGGIASRFSGMGTGSRHSSAFQNATTAAGSNFAMDLASRRQELQMQAIKDLMGLSDTILRQRPYERDLFEKPQKQPSGWGGFGGALIGGIGGFAASGGNVPMALKSATLGYNVGSGF